MAGIGYLQTAGRFAQILLNNLKMLIFNESTVGLDPEERVRFRNLFSDLANDCIDILSYLYIDWQRILELIVKFACINMNFE